MHLLSRDSPNLVRVSFDYIAQGVVGWVTQLVVDASVRKRYIATQLLRSSVSLPLSTSRISTSVETFLRIVHLTLFQVHTQSFISIMMSHREALRVFMDGDRWCLGNLLDGHEYLIILPVVAE